MLFVFFSGSSIFEAKHFSPYIWFLFLVLEKDHRDKDAFICKCIAFLQNGQYEDLLQLLAKYKDFEKDVQFEKCYALYRTRQYQQALNQLRSSKDKTLNRMRLLEAQIVRWIFCKTILRILFLFNTFFQLFRLEEYAACAQIYESQLDKGEQSVDLSSCFIVVNYKEYYTWMYCSIEN
jgi:hypothetical protein